MGVAQRLVRAAEMLSRHRRALRERWVFETQQVYFLWQCQLHIDLELQGLHDGLNRLQDALQAISARRAAC